MEIPIALCLLCPEKNGVVAFIGRSFPEVGIEYLNDAQVTISYDSGYVQLYHISNGVYKNNDFQVQHNKEYKFSALLKSGKWLTATTKVPDRISILNIQPGDTLYYEMDTQSFWGFIAKGPEISWNSVDGTAYFLCYYQFEKLLENQGQHPIATADTFTNEIRLTFYIIDEHVNEVSILPVRNAKLLVCALDSCFYQYFNPGNFSSENFSIFSDPNGPHILPFPDFNSYERSNITNGNGVFGAYTYDAVDVVIALKDY